MHVAGIVLAGGSSTRMGRTKATLPFGPELMLQRIVRILGEALSPIVIAAAATQQLPSLPAGVLIARDQLPSCGPLEGIGAGLTLLAAERPEIEAAFVASCDVPLLSTPFVLAMIDRLGDAPIAAAVEGGVPHPLPAVFRVSVLPHIRALLEEGNLRMGMLLERLPTARIDVEDLRTVDPQLWFLKNCNRPEDYDEALQLAGFSPR